MSEIYVVSGIGTGVGKTIVSAILVKGLTAGYWKPVQAGTEPETDTETVQRLTGLDTHHFFAESYILQAPQSPHAAAEAEGLTIHLQSLVPPVSAFKNIIIEGAGGLMVPLNYETLFADWITLQKWPVILVCSNYLGSINHSLLSLELLARRGIKVKGIIFNGNSNQQSEKVISRYSGVEILGHIPYYENPDSEWIQNAFHKYISWKD